MKYYEVRRTIPASAAMLWEILTDAKRLQGGSFGILKIEGRIAPDQRLKLWSAQSPNRAFSLRVTEWVEHERMVWSGGMPLGLFRGVRQFNLTPVADGTEFHMREEFSGVMLPLIWSSMPDLTPSFETFAEGLHAAATGAST